MLIDPYTAGTTGELDPATEIAALIVRQMLPTLRAKLAELEAMGARWNANDLDTLIAAAETAGEPLAGHSAATWQNWQAVFNGLRLWMQTPIAEIGTTPAAVLLKSYPTQTAQQ